MPDCKLVWSLVLMATMALFVGCGSSSRTARLEPGNRVAIDPIGGARTVVLDTQGEDEEAAGFASFVLLEAGTIVEVESDDQPIPEGPDEAGLRQVKVFVWDGPDKGKVGWLTREDLRP